MKRYLIVSGLAAIVLAAVFYIAIDLHRDSQREVVAQAQEYQLLQAGDLAHRIEDHLAEHGRELEALAADPSVRNLDVGRIPEAVRQIFNLVASHGEEIRIYDDRGDVVYSAEADAVGAQHMQPGFFDWAKKQENEGKIFVTPVLGPTSGVRTRLSGARVFLVTPLFQESASPDHPQPIKRFIGAVTMKIEIEKLITDFFGRLKKGASQVWVMDKDGTLLVQSEHPEMVMRNIHAANASCLQCHVSFDYVQRILDRKQGVAAYRLRDNPNKLAAFAPVNFQNASWFVVVNSSHAVVTAFVNTNWRKTMLLLGLVALGVAGGFTVVYHGYRTKVRAQEEARQLRKKAALYEKIRESEEHHRSLVENARDTIFTLAADGTLTSLNPAFETITGWSRTEWMGKAFRSLVHPDDLAAATEMFRIVMQGVKLPPFELRILSKSGQPVFAEFTAVPDIKDGRVVSAQGIGRDITERKQAEDALRHSEQRFRHLFENSPDAVFVEEEQGTVLDVNPSACRLHDLPREQLLGKSALELVPPEERKKVVERLPKWFSGELTYFDGLSLTRDGTSVPVEIRSTPIEHGGRRAILLHVRDITERKRAEQELKRTTEQLRKLSRRLLEVQETERRHIARELHDEIGQALTMLKINLQTLERDAGAATVRADIQQIAQTAEDTLQQVRNLAVQLRPSVLDDLGLEPALRWDLDRLTQAAGLTAEFAADPLVQRPSPEIEIACFRVAQEALTNVVKHARAKHVRMELREQDSELLLVVRDDGAGFDTAAASQGAAGGGSFGLLGMQERVALVEGKITIKSAPHQGTEVHAWFPLAAQSAPKASGETMEELP